MGQTARGPGSLHIKAAAYELLRKHERDAHLLPLCLSFCLPSASFSFCPISCLTVSVPAAVMGSSSCDLACRHADGRVYRPAVALPKLQRPSSERSEVDLLSEELIFLECNRSLHLFVLFCYRPHPVWDRKAEARLAVISAGSSEPRPLLPRPPTALRCVPPLTPRHFLPDLDLNNEYKLVHFDPVPYTPPCFRKYSKDHQMCIHPPLKIVPLKMPDFPPLV